MTVGKYLLSVINQSVNHYTNSYSLATLTLNLFTMRFLHILTAVSILLAPLISSLSHEHLDPQLSNLFGNDTTTDGHTNNWAVLVCSSRYWFNYRVRVLTTYTQAP